MVPLLEGHGVDGEGDEVGLESMVLVVRALVVLALVVDRDEDVASVAGEVVKVTVDAACSVDGGLACSARSDRGNPAVTAVGRRFV